LNDTEETKVAGPSGPRISTGPVGRSLFGLTGPTVNILATGQWLRRPLPTWSELFNGEWNKWKRTAIVVQRIDK
jgi:hypothetical protein